MQFFLFLAVRLMTVLALSSFLLFMEMDIIKTYARKGRLADFVETIRLGIAGSSTLEQEGSSDSNGGIISPPAISLNQDMRTTEINKWAQGQLCKQAIIVTFLTWGITSTSDLLRPHQWIIIGLSMDYRFERHYIIYWYWSGLECILYKTEWEYTTVLSQS